MSSTLTILLTGSLIAASLALLGSFLVLRRLALLGDAISHAVLPGIVIAFLLTSSRSTLPMLIGAGILGVITVMLVETLNRSRRLAEDASMGVVFPALFSIGVILIARLAGSVDLDLECVLYGEIAYAPWDLLIIGDTSLGPRPLWVSGGLLLMDLILVLALFKELKISTFDPGLAAALGFSPVLLHYVLMSAVSVTVVGSFESVGAILVVAMLIVPPATAYLLTDHLGRMIALAVLLGVSSAIGGYWAARWWDASIAGSIATVAGLQFLLALLFSPSQGVVQRLLSRRAVSRRLHGQLLLMHLGQGPDGLTLSELAPRFAWSARLVRRTVRRLTRQGFVESSADRLRLTESGHEAVLAAGGERLAHR